MTITLELMLTIASWIGAVSAITVFVKKIIKPLQALNTSITLMQRERLESAHAIFCTVMGWCPSGEKTVLSDLYRHYVQAGNNHIAGDYIEEICALPDHPRNGGTKEAILMQH